MTGYAQTLRRSNRSTVMLKATLELPADSLEVVLRNLSRDGALVCGDRLPEEGTRVLFHRQGLSAPARIAWVHKQHAGVAFCAPLFPRELLRHVPPAGIRPPPAIVRRPGLGATPLTQSEQKMVEEWAFGSEHALGA